MIKQKQVIGGGIDYIAETAADPDDTMRFRVRGDVYPRVEIDPRGTIKTGDGTVGPTLITSGSSGSGGGARAAYNVLESGLIRTTDPGYAIGATYLVNSFAFALLVAAHENEACDFIFPAGVYDTGGFAIDNPGQRIIGAGGAAANQGDPGRGTKFVQRGSGDCVTLRGVNGDRYFGLGVEGVKISNSSSSQFGLVLESLSHFRLEDVWVSAFRGDGGGFRAANAMDGALYDCCTDFCGSADGTNKAAVKLTATARSGATLEDACNEIRWFRHRYENISDRVLDYDSVGGLLVNKIDHFGCKFENSQQDTNGTNGSLDANQAWMRFDHADQIAFYGGDITVQALNTNAPGTLPRMMDIINGARVKLVGTGLFTGSLGAIQVFDTWIHAHGNTNNHLFLEAVQFNSANAGSFPTTVLKGDAATKPVINQHGVGFDPFQGSGKVGTDWYTAAEWSTLGQIA